MITTNWPDQADPRDCAAWLDAWDAQTAKDEEQAMAAMDAAEDHGEVRRIDGILSQIMEEQAEVKAARRRWCSETGRSWPEPYPPRRRRAGRSSGRSTTRTRAKPADRGDSAANATRWQRSLGGPRRKWPPAVEAEIRRILRREAELALDAQLAEVGRPPRG